MGGLFGIFDPSGKEEAALAAYLGLYALQHRGQESAGIVVSDGERMRIQKGMGLVARVFDEEGLESMPGPVGIGHVRYATAGTAHVANAQPLLVFSRHGQIALAHDGRLTNALPLRARLLERGSVFQTTTDSEVIVNLVCEEGDVGLEEALIDAAGKLRGAYAVIVMTHDRLIGLRDPLGIRPLAIGRRGEAWCVASESCAFDTVGAELVRDVEPGEMVVIDGRGLRSYSFGPRRQRAFCIFEHVYFARADSVIDGRTVHEVRKAIGRMLARKARIDADLVVPAPDSATSAALGFAEESGIPLDIALAKNRYVGRTFIQPTPAMRRLGVRIKLNPIREAVEGKRVILVDDSIVRGTTSGKTIELLRSAGAREVHMAVASPPFTHPCHYGIDVPSASELIAYHRSVDEVCRLIGADSLVYLDVPSLCRAVGVDGDGFCTACFSGGYPTDISDVAEGAEDMLEERGARR